VFCRRIDELEKTLASMRKSLGRTSGSATTTTTSPPIIPEINSNGLNGLNGTFAGASNFGHPLDMLARTAANTHSPDMERLNSFNSPVSHHQNMSRPPPQHPGGIRVTPIDSIPTTWSSDISGIDPIERGWLDIEDTKMLFERYPLSKLCHFYLFIFCDSFILFLSF